MNNKSLVISFLLLILCCGVIQVFGQQATKPIGTITVEVKSNLKNDKTLYFEVPVYQKIQDSLVRGMEGFSFVRSSITCELSFIARAIEEKPEIAIVTFYIATRDSTKSHSVTKRIKLKRGERNSFVLKPKIGCLNGERYSITAIY